LQNGISIIEGTIKDIFGAMFGLTLLKIDGDCPKKLRLLKPTNVTIHWKALEEHFLMAPLVFLFIF
jgi:hypothetical protein